jgi:hypothetical protein
MSKNWQTVTKRERERAVEQKRTLKRERKRAAAAEKAAIKNGTAPPESLEEHVEDRDAGEVPAEEVPAEEA